MALPHEKGGRIQGKQSDAWCIGVCTSQEQLPHLKTLTLPFPGSAQLREADTGHRRGVGRKAAKTMHGGTRALR